MSTIVGTNIEVTNLKYDSDTTSMIISNTGQITAQGEGTATTNLQQGLAKSWMNLNGTGSIAIRDSFNIGSLTDNGTGDYTVPLSNPMSDANYKVEVSGTDAVTGAASIMNRKVTLYANTAPTSSQYRLASGYNYYTASAFHDNPHIFTDIHGDLA